MDARPDPARRLALRWGAAIAWMAVIFIGSSVPGAAIPGGYSMYGHLAEYAVLGVLLVLALRESPIRRAIVIAVAVASLYGVTDELHQAFVPLRSPDPADWALDTLGALAGALLCAALLRTRRRRHTSQ